ncbi:replication-associated protein [Porcine associated circular DNA virus-10]|nr:replication-associated protein [Porcine associated circular DNA virus-10]
MQMTSETMTSQSSGNTNQSLRARSFLLTLNEIEKYEDLKNEFQKLKSCDYFISCKEIAPTTGHEHIHIYAHFSSQYKISKRILNYHSHIDICRGTPQQNIAYIRKDGNILDTWGKEPHQGFHTVKDLKQIDKPDELNWNEFNTWSKIHQNMANDIDIDEWNKEVKVYYIQGPSGVGKTEKAKQIVRENIEKYGRKINRVKCENNFWIGVGEEAKIAIYDDFRDSHMKASEFVNFIDYNKQIMNTKGGSKLNNYELIIITSVQNINDIYHNMIGEPRKQWMRRVEVINMYEEDSDDMDIDDL